MRGEILEKGKCTIGDVHLNELEIFKGNPTISIKLLDNIYFFLVQQLFAATKIVQFKIKPFN